ncbi:aldehyde dehydrogenase family protein [Euzebya tangerina]|uniref:aldehyde dehydrogenase family protein n=1 Tax=Euzebya tangerina TaxID=591198 RepID=UPI000E3237BF|nr:aldehyde dehydrogenase family protein [Euzebya tangerina]
MTDLSTDTAPTGCSIIAGAEVRGPGAAFQARVPGSGEPTGPTFGTVSSDQLDEAVRAAREAAADVIDPLAVSTLLGAIADRLEQAGEQILPLADAETALGTTRLTGELARTVGQFRMMARAAGEATRRDHVIDPEGDALTEPALLRTTVPLGVVAVFAASNFPLAFGVAGTDTSAALAGGCPVVAKAHPAQPGTAEMVGRIMTSAVADVGLHPGWISIVHEQGHELGAALVQHQGVDAVAFTGSLRGGRALFDLAAQRPRPIPVYAEMGSLNPVVISPGAAAARGQALADGIAGSFLLGEGQFCTKPGLILLPADDAGAAIRRSLIGKVTERSPAHPLLYDGITRGFGAGLDAVSDVPGVAVHRSPAGDGSRAAVVVAPVDTLLEHRALREEVFGPVTVLVDVDQAQLPAVLDALDPSLTGTLHFEPDEATWATGLADRLARKVGRVIAGGFPTGVRVSPAQHHGGPYPATTAPLHTSVGLAAIDRFRRPVAFQSFDDAALPNWVPRG